MAKAKFFKSKAQLRQWFVKNHNKASELWIGIHKRSSGLGNLKQSEAMEILLCFGWSFASLRGIDQWSYMLRATPRKLNGLWSLGTINAAKKLHKLGLMHPAGWQKFLGRNKKRSEEKPPEFSSAQTREFRANKAAWTFFKKQTASYQRHMTWWVISAVQEQTKLRRLRELIHDSGNGSKLARVVAAAEKYKRSFPPGETPVEEGKNIGQVVGAELRSVGISTLENLQSVGWEDAFHRLTEMHPHRINANAVTALIGAVENTHRLKIDAGMKAEGLALVRELKRGL